MYWWYFRSHSNSEGRTICPNYGPMEKDLCYSYKLNRNFCWLLLRRKNKNSVLSSFNIAVV